MLPVLLFGLAAAVSSENPPHETMSYRPGGRRDPFVAATAVDTPVGPCATAARGLRGLRITEVAVRGIVRVPSGTRTRTVVQRLHP
jgi:hypothetical protein